MRKSRLRDSYYSFIVIFAVIFDYLVQLRLAVEDIHLALTVTLYADDFRVIRVARDENLGIIAAVLGDDTVYLLNKRAGGVAYLRTRALQLFINLGSYSVRPDYNRLSPLRLGR